MSKKLLTLISVIFIVSILITSCNNKIQIETTDTIINSEEIISTMPEYTFPELNYNGEEFYILNTDSKVWGAFSDIVIEEEIGEVLNDTVYYRNQFIEETFNIKLKQMAIHPDNIISRAFTLIQAGDDTYSTMFVSHGWQGAIGTIVLENEFYNLAKIPELQIDRPWWNNNINDRLKIGESDLLYFASNDIDVYNMQAIIAIFFNEKIAENLNISMPYDLVRNGKWTLDVLNNYLKSATNLNGDDDWTWDVNGNFTYGYTSYHMGATTLLLGTDVKIVDFDNENLPYFAAENEYFYNAVQKLSNILSIEGQYIYADGKPFDRMIDVFQNNRTLFVDGAISNASLLREMEDSFGILPMPKYNENQENYCTTIHPMSTFTVIPVTNKNPETTAIILDAMAYLSYKDVRPAYFDVALSLKQLRNDDSIDMLEILLNTRSIHLGYVYGWTTDFMNNNMRKLIQISNPNIASTIEQNRNIIENNIQTTLDYFNGK